MTKKDKAKVLEIIKEAMDWTLSADMYIEGDGDERYSVEGKDDFLKEVERKLNEL